MYKTDIIDCYSIFYTYTIAQGIVRRNIVKSKKSDNHWSNKLDECFKAMHYRQTNGIL